MVKLLLFASIREHLKAGSIHIEATTTGELLKKLKYSYPEITELIESSVISVNKVIINNPEHPICMDDQVAIIPPISSG